MLGAVARILMHLRAPYQGRLPTAAVLFLVIIPSTGYADPGAQAPWEQLAPGMELALFKGDWPSPFGDSTIVVLRIDVGAWDLRFLCASQTGDEGGLTAKQWCDKYSLVAATNAGMFATDYNTHVGFMKNGSHANNASFNHYLSAAATDPLHPGLPRFRIFDLDAEAPDSIRNRYRRVIQNLRLVKRPRESRWSPQKKIWSEVALGEDSRGSALLIFCGSPYSMYEFNRILLSLPIDLQCAQHLEGGVEAQLYVKCGSREYEFVGLYGTRFAEDGLNDHAWRVPNVIGVARRLRPRH